MNYWLIKSEGDCYSIDDLRKDGTAPWTGIRNFQARNYMRDGMKKGNLVLFYHSMSDPTGVYGIAEVASDPHLDLSAFDPRDEHFDTKIAKAHKEGRVVLHASDPFVGKAKGLKPVEGWACVDMKFVKKLTRPVSLEDMKKESKLAHMLVLRKGQRLSVLPVRKEEYEQVIRMGK